jgi:murein DD-endopeptidase MepM/ murein hydrolase activator NlpD
MRPKKSVGVEEIGLMVNSLREQAWGFVCATFPERQVYVRSDGRVQFFTFNPLMQAILAGISVVALGWVAFTSVNTIFKDRIIASKEQTFRQMQGTYETRIANLHLSYDELNGAVVATEDHFRALVEDIEARHRTLAGLIRSKENLREELGLEAAPSEIDVSSITNSDLDSGVGLDSNLDSRTIIMGSLSAPTTSAIVETGQSDSAVPTSANENTQIIHLGIGGPTQSFLENTVRRLGSFFRGRSANQSIDHPSLRQMEELEVRLDRFLPIQRILVTELRDEISRDADRFGEAIRLAGLRPDALLGQASDAGEVGGPELSITPYALSGGDPSFHELALEATADFEDFAELATALRSMPIVKPVPTDNNWRSSGFGARRDPFTKQLAFHSGIDFSGPRGTDVQVTAPGKVVFAGANGAYGKSVEVDHGYGLKTRYGHLARIMVSVGGELEEGAVVGTLGSTGRTTGPHLHYEVWFNDTIRNPSKFLRAGRYVHEEQGY